MLLTSNSSVLRVEGWRRNHPPCFQATFYPYSLSRLTRCSDDWIGFPRGLMIGVVPGVGDISTGKGWWCFGWCQSISESLFVSRNTGNAKVLDLQGWDQIWPQYLHQGQVTLKKRSLLMKSQSISDTLWPHRTLLFEGQQTILNQPLLIISFPCLFFLPLTLYAAHHSPNMPRTFISLSFPQTVLSV